MKKKWITKSEIEKILKIYSIRNDEFRSVKNQKCFFKSNLVKGYTILIEPEVLKGEITVKTDRIMVTHSQSNGKKTYVDVWERDYNGDLQFRFRNLWNQPLSDADYIRELEQKNMQLQQAGQKLQDQLAADKPRNDNLVAEKLINNPHAEAEMKHIRSQLEELRTENEKLKQKLSSHTKHNARGAGRKPSKERLNAISQVKSLLDSGCNDQDIMHDLGISRATYYRYKKYINTAAGQH